MAQDTGLSDDPIQLNLEANLELSMIQNEVLSLQDTIMILEDIGRTMTRWKRRARNNSGDIQVTSVNDTQSRKRNLDARRASSDELLDDSCPKRVKSTEDEFHLGQNMAVAAE